MPLSSPTPTSTPQQPGKPTQIGELPALHEASLALRSKELSRASAKLHKASKTALFVHFVVFMVILFSTTVLLHRVHLGKSAEGSGFLYHLARGFWLLAAVHAALLAHEGGHVVAGRLVGWQPELIVAGMLVFDRGENGRWRVRLGELHPGGVAYSTVRSWAGVEHFRRSFRTIVAGGPIGSAIGFLIGIVILIAVAQVAGPNPPRWAGFVELASFISVFLAVMSLVPSQVKGRLYSDGAQLERWRPLDVRGVADRAWIPITAATQLSMGQRPREWDAEVVSLLETSTHDPEMGGVAAAFLAYRALDLADPPSAGQWLQLAINEQRLRSDGPMDSWQAHVALAATIYEGAWRRDADAARRWIAIARSSKMTDPWLRQVAVAALHFADGKPWHLDRASRRMQAIQAASPIPVSTLLLYTTIERLTANAPRSSKPR